MICSSYVVKEDQVNFFLHTRNSDEIQITDKNIDSIDANKVFYFITHGWNANRHLGWVQDLTAAYLEREDCNVIQVDWREPNAVPLYVAGHNTKDVGILYFFYFEF